MELMGIQVINGAQQTDKASTSKIVQQNKFDVFFNEEENNIRTDMIAQDLQLENEVNEELLRSSSRAKVSEEAETDSEFVDNSLDAVHKNIISPIQSESENDSGLDLAALERKNKEFLDKSWANIVEDEEGEKSLLLQLDALDGTTSAQSHDGFQVVKSKKTFVKKKPAVVSSYKTRGKAGNPKPFK